LFTLVGRNATIVLVGTVVLLIGYAVIRHPRRLAACLVPPLLSFSVLVPFTFGYAFWTLTRERDRAFVEPAIAPLLASIPKTRVVWIVFDEWDERLTFVDRPRELRLPALDRLRQSALLAENAYPPAGETALSLPSLLAGRIVKTARATGPNDLDITFADSPEVVRWGTEPNLISRARRNGFNIAVVGWYLPYCRVFKDSVSACSWMDLPVQSNSFGVGFLQIFSSQIRSLFETNLLSPFGQSLATARQAKNYEAAVERTLDVVTDPAFALTIIHLPAAHVPYFFNRFTNQPTGSNSLVAGYRDGLALADTTLARIRTAMEKSQLWDSTTILLSSDHWFRQSTAFDGKRDLRVPFLLKMRGQQTAVIYKPAFNTVLSADLLWATLTGELSLETDVSGWIGGHRGPAQN
jgi:hypothetical protein